MKHLSAALLVALLTPLAHADVVYDNLGPGDTYDPTVGWVVSDGPPFSMVVDQAMPFAPSASGVLDALELPLTLVSSAGNATLTIEIYSDNAGEPGSSLESFLFSGPLPANGQTPVPPLHLIDFPDTVALLAGQPYWIVISVAAPLGGNFVVWNQNIIGDVGTVADRRNGGPGWNLFPNQELAAFRVLTSSDVGTNYCGPAFPNSTGFPAEISASGSAAAAANNLTLTATGLPVGQFGYFLVSETQGFFNPPGSQGIVCLTANIGRFNQAAQIIQGPSGDLAVDLTALPVNPPHAVQPGETWNFQCWFRDNNPSLTSNFTDGISIAFL
ncbi:MAG: hypothetical protein GY711_35535 [bacterium]|nr:hypothetical protein [bacterium]